MSPCSINDGAFCTLIDASLRSNTDWLEKKEVAQGEPDGFEQVAWR